MESVDLIQSTKTKKEYLWKGAKALSKDISKIYRSAIIIVFERGPNEEKVYST